MNNSNSINNIKGLTSWRYVVRYKTHTKHDIKLGKTVIANEKLENALQRGYVILIIQLHIMLLRVPQEPIQNHYEHNDDEMRQFDIISLSDLPQLPDIVTHWLSPQRPYTTLLLTHR